LLYLGGALRVLGALSNFPRKLYLKKFFTTGGAGAPTAPPGYAFAIRLLIR